MTLKTTNLNTDPYYDDYDADKQYHRIIFKPGLAVQARELTQIQTVLQDQVNRFGEHVFKEGSIVTGCPFSLDLNLHYAKLRDADSVGNNVTVSSFLNTLVTGTTSNVQAYVVNSITGTEAGAPNYKTIFVKYITSGATTNKFANNEILTSNTGLTANTITTTPTGLGSAFTIGDGIIFAHGHFLKVNEQTLILDRYDNEPSYRIGLVVNNSIIASNSDVTLLDPAQGAYNYAAPGADRLKISPKLVKKTLTDTDLTNFFELIRIENGAVTVLKDRPQYAELRKELAKRTNDESGSYTVDPFLVNIREHLKSGNNQGKYTTAQGGDSNKLVAGIEPGLAYVKGYEYQTYTTQYINIDKATSYVDIEQQAVTANYGNYVTVNQVAGSWDINNIIQLSLRSAQANAINGQTYSTTTLPGTELGTARARSLQLDTGNPGDDATTYRLYLFDVKMTSGAFSDVRSIHANNAIGADGFADVVLNAANNAVMNETNFNKLVFQFPQKAIRRLRDSVGAVENQFQFRKNFDAAVATDSTFSVTTGASDELFPFSDGALNATQKDANFVVVMKTAASATTSGLVSQTAASNTVTGTGGTSFNTELAVDDKVTIAGETFRVHSIAGASSMTVTGQHSNGAATVPLYKEYYAGEHVDMAGSGVGSSRTITISGAGQTAAFDLGESFTTTANVNVLVNLNKTNAQEADKTLRELRLVKIDPATHYANTVGPWGLGVSDVYRINAVYIGTSYANTGTNYVNHFNLDTGQRDSLYEHASISLKPSSSLTISASDKIVVDLDYFYHDTSTGVGFFSVDSYPIDDTGVTPATIKTQDIPIYRSKTTGVSYDLRDSLDFRPRKADTITDTTALASATVNPANSSSFTIPSGGSHMVAPNENFTADLSYYLARKDRVIIDVEGNFSVMKGVPSLYPKTPVDLDDTMTLAILTIPPFPSLSQESGRNSNRPDYSVTTRNIDNRRYTMRDIGVLENRINHLEYYTSLSLLEKDTSDLTILDGAGLDRFKNGILVEPFTGHGVGDVFDADYKCSIDTKKGLLRPRFDLENIEVQWSANSTNVVRAANDVTIVVTSTGTYSNGENIYQGASLATATARGVLTYQVGQKLYIEQSQGTWATATAVVGDSSGTSINSNSVSTPTAGDLVTLPYTHYKGITQPFASNTRNLVSQLIFNWVGQIDLDPPSDHWVDTVTRPDVQVNFDGNMDAWEFIAEQAFETEWNSWQTVWSGEEVVSRENFLTGATRTETSVNWTGDQTLTTFGTVAQRTTSLITQRETRTGVSTTVIPETIQQRIGNSVVDVSIIPFIRSREVRFHGYRLRPNTRLYAYFDGEDVSTYVTPTDSTYANTGNEGSKIITDTTGNVYGLFRIPNDSGLRFRVGTKFFRLVDSANNVLNETTTAGSAEYTASGLLQTTQGTVISTRIPTFQNVTVADERNVVRNSTTTNIVGERVLGTRTIPNQTGFDEFIGMGEAGGGGGEDPLSQTFIVSRTGGGYLTKVDIFFSSKSASYPVTVQIREVINGYPSQKVLPFATKTLQPSEVNISTNATKPTPFVFPSPVFLKNGSEYAICIIPAGSNPDYRVWTAQLGGTNVGTTQVISKQPHAGILFVSANDRTWTPLQTEDLKFNLYYADFESATTGNLLLDNKPIDHFTLASITSGSSFDIGETIHGETVLTLASFANGTFTSANSQTVLGLTSGATATLTSVNGSDYSFKDVSTTKFTTSETLRFGDGFGTASTNGVTATISSQATPVGKLQYYQPGLLQMKVEESDGTFVANTQVKGQKNSGTAIISTIDDLQLNTLSTIFGQMILNNTNIDWSVKTTATNTLASTYSSVNVNKNTDFSTERNVKSKTNEINNMSGTRSILFKGDLTTNIPTVSPAVDLKRLGTIVVGNQLNNDSTGETGAGGNALSKYMTRIVTLNDGQDAEDLKVYLTAYKPSGTSVLVYYKILHGEDGTLFDDRPWVAMSQTTSASLYSSSEDDNDFVEYEFDIATAEKTGTNGEVQYTQDGVTYTGYKNFAIKIVLLSTNTSLVPKVRDLRAIALQI